MTKKPSVPERLRRQVQERAQGRCEYCLIHESDMYYPHEPDHVIAEKHGGPTSLDNIWHGRAFIVTVSKAQTLLLLTQDQIKSYSSFIHVSRDGIVIFASTVLLLKALPLVVALLSLFFISMMLNGWHIDLG
jgi:HNH endonuclease